MLQDWLDANPQYTKRALARELGFSDYSSLAKWIAGDRAMPIQHMLRFCNLFQVPLEMFFFDNDAPATLNMARPKINDQTEPTGGYVAMNSNGGPHYPSPEVEQRKPCRLPNGIVTDSKTDDADTTEQTASEGGTAQPQADMAQIFMAYQQALAQMQAEHHRREDQIRESYEHKWDKERDTLLEAMRIQREELERLRRGRYGMVAEGLGEYNK